MTRAGSSEDLCGLLGKKKGTTKLTRTGQLGEPGISWQANRPLATGNLNSSVVIIVFSRM